MTKILIEEATVKQAVEALDIAQGLLADARSYHQPKMLAAYTALQSIISQDAIYKMAEDAVTIGLRLDDWDKIGCVNHDCDQCKAAQPAQPAQPAVPDSIHYTDLSESLEYIHGWNDCRAEMLKGMK